MGTCPQELCARYLESRPDMSMAHPSECNQAQQPESVSVADVQVQARQQSAFLQPTAQAGFTQHTVMLGVTYTHTHLMCSTEKVR